MPQPVAATWSDGGMETQGTYDVVIVGGGVSGLSAALVLGRARRNVVIIDAGTPRNAPADAAYGFITRDGTAPERLVARTIGLERPETVVCDIQ